MPTTPPARPPRSPSPALRVTSPTAPLVAPLSQAEIDELQSLLDATPQPLEPLDVGMLDGFLCGVLVQPQRIASARWLPFVTDADGRPLPARVDTERLHALVLRRHAELDGHIARREWFDPWVFEFETDELDPVYPWVAGFAAAVEEFPGLMRLDGAALTGPLALLYRHLDPDDLEDADDLIEEMESFEPPENLTEAVEELVRATLLLADVGRPVLPTTSSPGPGRSRMGGPAAKSSTRPGPRGRR